MREANPLVRIPFRLSVLLQHGPDLNRDNRKILFKKMGRHSYRPATLSPNYHKEVNTI